MQSATCERRGTGVGTSPIPSTPKWRTRWTCGWRFARTGSRREPTDDSPARGESDLVRHSTETVPAPIVLPGHTPQPLRTQAFPADKPLPRSRIRKGRTVKVIPIASTLLYYGELARNTPYQAHPIRSTAWADELAEVAGRLCYQSWDRPNPKTATNEGYLANIIAQGHESVLEHASVTFYVEGVSRALLAELTRHRHLSFSVVSQRYVDASQLDMVRPPIVDELDTETRNRVGDILETQYQSAQQAYKEIVEILTDAGYKRKQAREAARAVLPNDTASPLIVTGNIRAWRWVIQKRYHPAADK